MKATAVMSAVCPEAVTKETDVAETVLKAASDTSSQLHFPAGADAIALAKSA